MSARNKLFITKMCTNANLSSSANEFYLLCNGVCCLVLLVSVLLTKPKSISNNLLQ